MREIRTLRAMWRGLETAYGAVSEALPTETGSNGSAGPTEHRRQSSTLPGTFNVCSSFSWYFVVSLRLGFLPFGPTGWADLPHRPSADPWGPAD